MLSISLSFNLILALAISFIVTIFLVPLFICLAFRLNIVDVPDGRLKKHTKTTPYLGGIAVYLAIILTLLICTKYNYDILILVLSTSALMILGLIDDIYVIKPRIKFMGQFFSVILLIMSNFYFKDYFFNKDITLFLNIFWNLSIINAFNLIDVMDGLCTSVAITATFSFLIISLIFNQYNIAIILASILGSLTGFLIFNYPRARIYLGDSGSMFIGGLLAIIPFLLKWNSIKLAIASSCALFIVPILELISLILIRSYKNIPFYLGSPDHFSIYLSQKGWNKKTILAYVAFINASVSLILILNILDYISFANFMLSISIILTNWFVILIF